jgi:hypothetical protein
MLTDSRPGSAMSTEPTPSGIHMVGVRQDTGVRTVKVKALGLVFLTAALVAPLAAQDAGAPQGTDTSAN